jgi:NitT/TauT family transport system ATP-binding protein
VEVSAAPAAVASGDGVVFDRIVKSFGSARELNPALGELSLEVPRGQFCTVIGPSGSGKSTLLRIAAGLLDPDSGTVSIFGSSVADARRAKRIGLVPQSPALLPWRSVLENVRLPQEVNRAAGTAAGTDPEALLAAVGLGAVRDRRPNQLSGGMQQRVAIARAFAHDHALLLMDEPFSALDELNRERIRQQLLELWSMQQKTVLFVTHSVSEAVILSDTIVVLTSRPGTVCAVVAVDLPRPRDEAVAFSDEYRTIEKAVRAALRSGWRSDG